MFQKFALNKLEHFRKFALKKIEIFRKFAWKNRNFSEICLEKSKLF